MNVPFVDLSAQYHSIRPEIDKAIADILENTSFIGGSVIEKFESDFARYSQQSHCISCANGTDAIEIALEALGIGDGDEVIVPAYTWISTASAVSRVGAVPVFVDVDPEYYTIDVSQIQKKINSRTKAIIPVHFYGLPADMPAIMQIANDHKLKVVEDCAQAHGAEISGKPVGSFGHVATFSFYPGKNLGAYGDAGAITTDDEHLAVSCRRIARLGQEGKHNHVTIGRNSRMDTLQAAILNVKLKYLEAWTEDRRQHAATYRSLLSMADIQLPAEPESFRHVYHVFAIQLENRDEVRSRLSEAGIGSQLHYPKPVPRLLPYDNGSPYPVADAMSGRLLSLPMYAELTTQQLEYVAENLTGVLRNG